MKKLLILLLLIPTALFPQQVGGASHTSGYVIDGDVSISGLLPNGDTVGDGKAIASFNIKTLKYTIGDPTNTGTDYTFFSVGTKQEQSMRFDGASIIPALSRVIDVVVVCTENWTGSAGNETGLSTEIGNASGGAQYVTVANVDDLNDVANCDIDKSAMPLVSVSATSVFITCTPTINDWLEFTDGAITVYITYIDNSKVE